jgi:hypothetical protein
MLIRLSGEPERSYGHEALDSKYANDDGGPSLWWRDGRVKELQARLGQFSTTEAIRRSIVDTVLASGSPDVLDRLQRYIDRSRVEAVENASQVLDGFAAKEDRLRWRDRISIGVFGTLFAGVVAALFVDLSLTFWHIVLLVVTFGVGMRALVALVRRDGGYFGGSELRAIRPPDQAA